MTKYCKRPVVVDAAQWNGDWLQVAEWLDGIGYQNDIPVIYRQADRLCIVTRVGTSSVSPGDWIIRDMNGEFYQCNINDFAATYEPVVIP